MIPPGKSFFFTGGTVPRDAPSYVVRTADTELLTSLRQGQLCYVLTSRQMGKSSLMVRTAARLRNEGATCAVLDLTAIGQNVTPERWYDGLLNLLARQLGLEDELDLFWSRTKYLGPMQRWMQAVQEVVLSHCAGKVVLFIDEIDAVRSLPFSPDEFFAGIRECYNQRTEHDEFSRLTFCLLGVAIPTDLIRDTRITPFNVGRRIELTDFTPAEAAPLARGLGPQTALFAAGSSEDSQSRAGNPRLLERILYWTGGHPYLTQRLCQEIVEQADVKTPRDVDLVCGELFLSPNARERDDNLLFVRERLLRSEEDSAALLGLFARVWQRRRVEADETNPLVTLLQLSGVAQSVRGELKVRNRIYHRVFDLRWIRQNFPDAEARRQRTAYRRGLLRSAAVAAVVVAALAALAATAIKEAREARAARRLADMRTATSDRLAADLKRALADVTIQRNRADAAAHRALDVQNNERRQKVIAQNQRKLAETKTEESRQRVVRMNVAAGLRLLEDGDPSAALLHFAEAKRLDSANPTARRVHEIRIETTLAKTPQLLNAWWGAGRNKVIGFTHTGRKAIDLRSDGRLELYDFATNTASVLPIRYSSEDGPDLLSPDGRFLLTVDRHAVARLWNTTDGAPASPPLVHAAPIKRARYLDLRASFDASGQYLATICADNSIVLWNTRTGTSRRLQLDGNVNNVEISRDGNRVTAYSHIGRGPGGMIRVWSTGSGQVLGSLAIPRGLSALPLHLSADGRTLAAHFDSLLIWKVDSGVKPAVTSHPTYEAGLAVISLDGSIAAGYTDTALINIVDASSGKRLAGPLEHGVNVGVLAFSPNGDRLASGGADGSVRIWDSRTGRQVSALLKCAGGIVEMRFSPDGRRLLVRTAEGMLSAWDVTQAELRPRVLPAARAANELLPSANDYVHFSPNSRLMAIRADMSVQIYDVESGRRVGHPITHGGTVNRADFALSGQWLLTASDDGTARVSDAMTGRLVGKPLLHGGPVTAVALSADRRQLVTAGEDGFVRLWDARTHDAIGPSLKLRKPVRNALFSRDRRHIAIWCGSRHFDNPGRDYEAHIWDLLTGKDTLLGRSAAHTTLDICFTPDGHRLLTASGNTTVQVWDVDTSKPALPPLPHSDWLNYACVSPDGRKIATAEVDGWANLWDTATGRRCSAQLKHGLEVTSTSFTSDSSLLLTASSNGFARLWDVATGEEVAALHDGGRVVYAEISPDGRHAATASGGAVRLWTLPRDARPSDQIVRQAELLSGRRLDPTLGVVPLSAEALHKLWARRKN